MTDPDAARDGAALSSIASILDEVTQRITEIADRYAATPASGTAEELYAAERSLLAARRMVQRARSDLE